MYSFGNNNARYITLHTHTHTHVSDQPRSRNNVSECTVEFQSTWILKSTMKPSHISLEEKKKKKEEKEKKRVNHHFELLNNK